MRLTFHNISRSYGAHVALRSFSTTMEPGVYALLGPNGSGKTTLMNILTDNLRADSGHITFEREGIEEQDTRALGVRFRERVGYMPQYPAMYPGFSAEEFLWYMAALKDVGGGLGRAERRALVREEIAALLAAVELTDVAHKRIGALSGGMKQRLALAQAVLGHPDVLVLDEPSAGLDPRQRIAIRNHIAQLALDRIVILATHVVSDVAPIARRVILLKRGEILRDAAPQELTEELTGRVWCASVPEADVDRLRQHFCITSMNRDEGAPARISLRIVSDVPPVKGAVHTLPTLEDHYLFLYGKV